MAYNQEFLEGIASLRVSIETKFIAQLFSHDNEALLVVFHPFFVIVPFHLEPPGKLPTSAPLFAILYFEFLLEPQASHIPRIFCCTSR